ncbi:MAG: GTPase-associated system all-helical protein GASH [Planctomycetota bacterium]
MITKTFEWYRIVSATPGSQAVEARSKVATELTASLSEQDPSTLLAMAQGIACGFIGSPGETETVEWLLRTLKQHDPAVSENLLENNLELRCIAAITLGEILRESKEAPEERATAAAAAFVTAMHMRPLPNQRYLKAMVEEIFAMAQDVLEAAADARRERIDFTYLQDNELAVPDLPAAKKAILQLQSKIADLEQNADMDREEIRLFWFLSTGLSQTKKKRFSALPVSIAAVHAALDLNHFVLIPATLNCFELLAVIVESKREDESLKPMSLKEHLTYWSSEEWDAIAVADSVDADLASKFPAVFPVIWIANRMRESQALPNWTEFKRVTRLRGDANLSATQLGRQLLNEKITVALMGELLE